MKIIAILDICSPKALKSIDGTMAAITNSVVVPGRASCLSLAHTNQPSFGVPVKKLLVFGLLTITSTTSFAGQKFDPLTGKIDCNGDLDCFRKQQEDKNPLSIFNRPSQNSAPTQVIKIQDAGHSHLGTIEGLIELDLKNHHLSLTELSSIKNTIKTFMSGIDAPEHLSGMYQKFNAETGRAIDKMNQEQLIASMTSFGEISRTLGQDGLHSGASYFLSELAPQLSEYMVRAEGFESPTSPMASIKINAQHVTEAFQKMERGDFIQSHSSGYMMSGKRSGASGQWTDEDRAHAAVTQSIKRMAQGAGGGAVAGGYAGTSVFPGVGTVAGGITGGVLGGAGGALWGAVEGYNHPDLGGSAPTGKTEKTEVTKRTDSKTVTDPKTGKEKTTNVEVTTTTTTVKDLKTGNESVETTVVENKVSETCGGKPCSPEEDKPATGGTKCEDPYDLEYRSVPLTPEQAAAEKRRLEEQKEIFNNRLILLTEPRYKNGSVDAFAAEFVKTKKDSVTNPGFDQNNESKLSPGIDVERFDPLFDPQRDALNLEKLKAIK